MIRWVGRATKVMAMSKIDVPYRRDENGDMVGVTIPDHVDILCQLANGAQAHMRFSAATGLSTGNEVWLYGSEGTIRLDHRLNVFGGKRGDQQLSEFPNPEEKQAYWRVEEEFVSAIRGQEKVSRTPFGRGSALHGVHRGGNPQRPDWSGRLLAPLTALQPRTAAVFG